MLTSYIELLLAKSPFKFTAMVFGIRFYICVWYALKYGKFEYSYELRSNARCFQEVGVRILGLSGEFWCYRPVKPYINIEIRAANQNAVWWPYAATDLDLCILQSPPPSSP